MYTISTQLAKAVFDIGDFFYKDNPSESVKIENGIITYTVGKSSFDKPVDSFFFMCKSKALMYGYILLSKTRTNSSKASCSFDINGKHDYEDDFHNDFRAETEQQAVFDATSWVIEQVKNNKQNLKIHWI